MKYATKPGDLPPGEHYVILVFRTISTSYDRMDDSTVQVTDCCVFDTKEEWLAEIERKSSPRAMRYEQWVPLIVRRPTVNVSVKVDING